MIFKLLPKGHSVCEFDPKWCRFGDMELLVGEQIKGRNCRSGLWTYIYITIFQRSICIVLILWKRIKELFSSKYFGGTLKTIKRWCDICISKGIFRLSWNASKGNFAFSCYNLPFRASRYVRWIRENCRSTELKEILISFIDSICYSTSPFDTEKQLCHNWNQNGLHKVPKINDSV